MKRFFCFLFVLIIFPVFCLSEGFPDLSGYSLDDLLKFRVYLQYCMWQTDEWESVTVQPGVWEIGVDIPAGHWSVCPADGCGPDYIIYASGTKDQGHDVDLFAGEYIMECICSPSAAFYSGEYKTSTDIIMEAGHFVRLDCAMVFTPYAGKPLFNFKQKETP